jgi:hypothetical protein
LLPGMAVRNSHARQPDLTAAELDSACDDKECRQ